MATKTQIKNYIKDRVYTNTKQAITGDGLQETLCKVVDDLELGSSTGGVEKNYVDSQDKMTLDEAKKYTDAKVAGGGEALLTWRYSTVASKDAPLDPDKAPDLWHAAPQTADDHWAALKETGGKWTIWPTTTIDGSDGRGIKDTDTTYVLSDQGVNPPQSGWSESIPAIVEGKYLWSRTITTYTDNTQDTIYTVTYIGKDGNDGKNGKSVNIKGSLDGISQLPTSPTPSENDGYIIGEDLWVYTKTDLENETNHNGFTNVGKVSVKGDSACLHLAWANTLAPDYENFTTQKPRGQRFRYMGSYVDYSEDPSTCVDSENPEDYYWQEVIGEQGESVIVADIDDMMKAVALTYDGKTTSAMTFSPVVSMWYGGQQLTLDRLEARVVGTDYANNVIVVPNKTTGVVSVSFNEGVELSTFYVDITVAATVNEIQYVKLLTFSVLCAKAGAPGEDAVLYKLEPSTKAIKRYSDGSVSDLTISCKKIKIVGKVKSDTTDGTLYYKIDAKDQQVYTGAIDTSLISSKIHFEYIVNDVLWDIEDIYIVEDGSIPKVVDTKYSYAITMNHVIPSDDSWTEPAHLEDSTPIEGLPGQYLWTKIIYTWSDGTVTYSISYARCGFDGKDGKTKPSVVTYKGVWKSDGLYTGTETDDSIIVDIVYFTSAGAVDGKYYMAIQTKKFVNESTPQPDTDEGKAYWSAFQGQYANIATDFLFSQQVVSNLIQAINVNATRIDADKINTDDLVAKVVRTSESGERVVIEKDVLTAYNVNGNKTLVVDSGVQVGDSLAEYNKYFKVPARISAYSRSFAANTSSINSETKSYTIGQVVIPDSDYSYVLTTSKLRVGLRYGWTGSAPSGVNVTNTVSVDIYAIIGSNKTLIGSGALQSSGTDDGSIRFITVKPYVRSVSSFGTVTFTIEVTHRASISGSSTSTHNVYVDLFELSTFCALLNNGVVISDAISMGVVDDDTHCMVGAGYDGNYAVFDAVASGNGIKVRNDGVILTDYEYGDRRLIAPYMVDIRTTGNKLSMKDAIILSKCYDAGVPAYIKGVIQIGGDLVTYLAQIKCVRDISWTTNTVARTFFASCDAHNMKGSSWSDSTDYRVNVFFDATIYNTYLIESASDTKNISVTQYLHTV